MPDHKLDLAAAHAEITRLTGELELERTEVRRWRIVAHAIAEAHQELAKSGDVAAALAMLMAPVATTPGQAR